jgi:hypothetical protein
LLTEAWTQAYLLSHSPATFCDGFFKIRSHELLAWAAFEPWSLISSSWGYRCHPPRIAGVGDQCQARKYSYNVKNLRESLDFYLPIIYKAGILCIFSQINAIKFRLFNDL